MRFKLGYTIKIRYTVKVSPHTGKEYKKPRTHRDWIQIVEYVYADTLKEALQVGKTRANVNTNFKEGRECRLDLVEQEDVDVEKLVEKVGAIIAQMILRASEIES